MVDASSKRKHAIISLSFSDQDDGDEESEAEESDDDESNEENEESEVDHDDDDDDDDDESNDDDDDDDDEEEELSEDDSGDDDDDDADDTSKGTAEVLCNRVVYLLRRGKNLRTLKLDDCKAYLRQHDLRLSGTKATCIERILEHWRIKDGNGEKLYPRASFLINCKGDVCKGDVILFKQRVYETFDIVTRGGSVIGKRTVAARVLNESYGAAKQQHTFTVEVLWSKGVKQLPPLSSMLVKGRNLYRLETFRQRWSNEAERSKVLAEKHRRGAAARHVRANAKARFTNKGSKRSRNSSTARVPPNKRRRKESECANRKEKQSSLLGEAPSNGKAEIKQVTETRYYESSTNYPRQPSYTENGIHTAPSFHQRIPPPNDDAKMKQVAGTRYHEPSAAHLKHTVYHENKTDTRQSPYQRIPNNQYYAQIELHRRNAIASSQDNRGMFHLPSYNAGYYPAAAGASHHQIWNMDSYVGNQFAKFTPQFDPRNSNHLSRHVHFSSGPAAPQGVQFYRWRPP